MRTVRIVLAMVVALSIAAAAVAQEKPKKKGARLSQTAQAMLRIDALRQALEGLDLTAEQKEKLGKVREEFGPKMKEVFSKLGDILTEEQKSSAEESVKKAKDAGKKGREFFQSVESSLKLTDEQKEKMDKVAPELRAIQKEMVKAVMEVLTPEQQAKIKEKLQPPAKKERKPREKKATT